MSNEDRSKSPSSTNMIIIVVIAVVVGGGCLLTCMGAGMIGFMLPAKQVQRAQFEAQRAEVEAREKLEAALEEQRAAASNNPVATEQKGQNDATAGQPLPDNSPVQEQPTDKPASDDAVESTKPSDKESGATESNNGTVPEDKVPKDSQPDGNP